MRDDYVHGYSDEEANRLKDQAIDSGLIDAESWEKGINDLYKTTEADGVFFYNC